MNIAFTICSNNYLAQAKTLADSIREYSSDIKFVIGLCDIKIDEINYDNLGCEVIQASEVIMNNFDSLCLKYNIVELNTSVKASFFKFLINRHSSSEFIYYFDPDIEFFDNLDLLNAEFENECDILLTPHIINPLKLDYLLPSENIFLNNGIYNLGFLGLRVSSANTLKLLNWWEERLLEICFDNVKIGLFVDQLWFNLVPIYFDKVKLTKKMGYNCAPWNLHERLNNFETSIENVLLNDNSNLVFYHFSNYNYKTPDVITPKFNRVELKDNIFLRHIYSEYHKKLLKNGIEYYSTFKCFYLTFSKEKLDYSIRKNKLISILKDFIPPIFLRFIKRISKKFK